MNNYKPYSSIFKDERIEFTDESFIGRNHIVQVNLKMKEVNICPACSSTNVIAFGCKTRNIKMSILSDYNSTVILKYHRLHCKACGKLFMDTTDLCLKKQNISLQVKLAVIEDLRQDCSFTYIALKRNLTTQSVINIFESLIHPDRVPFGDVLCVDEFKNLKRYWRILSVYSVDVDGPYLYNPIRKCDTPVTQIIDDAVNLSPKLIEAYVLTQDFLKGIREVKFEDSTTCLDNYISNLTRSSLSQFNKLADMFLNWKLEILNSFIRFGDERLHNGYIEGINNKIKVSNVSLLVILISPTLEIDLCISLMGIIRLNLLILPKFKDTLEKRTNKFFKFY